MSTLDSRLIRRIVGDQHTPEDRERRTERCGLSIVALNCYIRPDTTNHSKE